MFNILITSILLYLSRLTTKPTKWHVRPAKTQINLGIRPVWSESSLSTWGKLKSLAIIKVHGEASGQTGWMPRLILVMRRLILLYFTCVNNNDFYYFEAFHFLKLFEKARVFIYPCTCMSPFIMSDCRRVAILTFFFHDGLRVSLFIYGQ